VVAQWTQGSRGRAVCIARSATKIFTGDGEAVRDRVTHCLTVSCKITFCASRGISGKNTNPPRPLRNLRVLCAKIVFIGCLAPAAFAQDANTDPFTDTHDGGKLHTASGFVCPARISAFERDAVGEADPETHTDFCAYSARDGVYGTIKLVPLAGPYDAQSALAPDFAKTESLGGKRVADGPAMLAAKPQPLVVYARTYEIAKLDQFRYRVMFSGAQFGNWAVETTIEYADPRDTGVENQFLHAVYAMAEHDIAVK